MNRREIDLFPCTLPHFTDDIRVTLAALADRLMQDFQHNARYLTSNYGKYGVLTIQSFQPRLSKPIIDEIDRVLARQYGLRDEELDFIVNYDIKYRIGAEPDADED